MNGADTISVIVIALNEEANIGPTVREVEAAVRGEFEDYEILVCDDGSTDGTGAEADRLARADSRIQVVHNGVNRGLGWNYRAGIGRARMRYVTWVCGKHDIEADQLRHIFAARTKADLVVPYHTNDEDRPRLRQAISRLYVRLLNVLFGLRLRHYNESVVLETSVARAFVIRTDSYAFQAELLIKALQAGHSHVDVPIRNLFPPGQVSKAFRLKNVAGVAGFLCRMLWDVHVARRCGRQG